jgi:murein DD-endopeptidase MepM/ murein hydrolase activator NlpD
VIVLALISALLGCGRTAETPTLALPIDCEVGVDCWISNRPDVDPTPAIRDPSGGDSTYDGHQGTDLAVRDSGQAAATWVRAPIAGTVLRTRNNVPDGQLAAGGALAVGDEKCGNGVVIDAGDQWEVQLCHLRWGSVIVHDGDEVTPGAPLGRVGWSGWTDHPHVHMTVRHQGRVVDPFTGAYLDDGSAADNALVWGAALPEPHEMDALVWAGFDVAPLPDAITWPLDSGRAVLPASTDALVLAVFLWRPVEGDVLQVTLKAPDGTRTSSEVVQPNTRPRQVWRVTKSWPDGERPVGLWTAEVTWRRGERTRTLHTTTVLE